MVCAHLLPTALAHARHAGAATAYMLNTGSSEYNAVFYSYLACFVNILTLNTYVFMSYIGLTRRNTLLWLRHRNK